MEKVEKLQESTKKKFRIRVNPKRDIILMLIGVLLAFTLRFIFVGSDVVHYHANFALYVNGQRDEFKNFTFYEEVASCSGEDIFNAKSRVHMHDKTFDTIHVHDAGATWGHFFANLGYTLGDKVVKTQDGVFVSGVDGKKLRFILNKEPVDFVANMTIRSEDRLLIDYGNSDDTTLIQRFESIPDNAHEYNEKPDPQSCSGGANESFSQRFKRTLGIPVHKVSNDTSHTHK